MWKDVYKRQLLLRALQEKTDWKHEPYKSLPATSPFVSQLRLKSILSRMEAVQGLSLIHISTGMKPD